MQIPVRNTYHLLCYAWDRLGQLNLVPVGLEDGPPRVDGLVADVLAHAVERQLTRGLDRNFREMEVTTSTPRGRLMLGPTVARATGTRGKLVCAVSERTPDVLHNRIVRATLERLAACRGLDVAVATRLRRAANAMVGVRELVLTEEHFARVQLHANIADYRFILQLCGLVHRCLVPQDGPHGGARFRDFSRDERFMGRLFEAFVRNFWQIRLRGWTVRKNDANANWRVEGAADAVALVPGLETDVLLQTEHRTLVVETKFVHSPTYWHYGKEQFVGDHLRQLFAYLEAHDPGGHRGVEGLLLYAAAGSFFDHRITLNGHPVWIRALDLARPWHEIEDDLLRLPEAV